MSALTKVFVVLHVVMSLLLTAGLIVFVNRVDDFQTNQTNLQRNLDAEKRRAELATAEIQSVRSSAQALVDQANNEVRAIRAELSNAQGTTRQRDKELADARAKIDSLSASIASATQALEVSQGVVGELNKQVDTLRQTIDKVQQQNTETQLVLSDRVNRLQVATRELRLAQEEIQSLREQLAQARAGGGDGGEARPAGGGIGGADPVPSGPSGENINGVVRAKQRIGGIDYATISVGSADGVQRGMRFNVLDSDGGNFLGFLRVDSVEPDNATGQLEGPRVDAIQQGSRVQTQL